jgi:hypothetical protein
LLTIAQSNDRETSMTQSDARLQELAILVWPPMRDSLDHRSDDVTRAFGMDVFTKTADYPTHNSVLESYNSNSEQS